MSVYQVPSCAKPEIAIVDGKLELSSATDGVTFYYTINGATPTTLYDPSNKPDATDSDNIKAIATKTGYHKSEIASIAPPQYVTNTTEMTNMYAHYILDPGFTISSSVGTDAKPFCGVIDGGLNTFSGAQYPLVAYADGAVIKNVILSNVSISTDGNVGAIAGEARGYTRIYNCGILPTSSVASTTTSGENTGYCGGIVGWLKDDSRVINCFSYADIAGGIDVAGIVGHNEIASTAEVTDGKYANLRTAVVNCMFYGNITSGATRYPVYGGAKIVNNTETGINNYNFYRAEASVGTLADYNCSWPAKEEYLTRYEFYRYLLNSNRELCGWWVGAPSAPSTMTTAAVQDVPKDASLMAKWVLDPSIAPYPILKPAGKYPSVINPDPDQRIDPSTKAWVRRVASENTIETNAKPDTEGQTLGTVTVTIDAGSHHSGSAIRVINITAMDIDNNDFCYGKIQLPYYNEVFGDPNGTTWSSKYGNNYTDMVVTGWDVTTSEGTPGTFSDDPITGNNFADRNCTAKDEKRTFAQGGYYYVPYGVSNITITAHWGKAYYLDNGGDYYDRTAFSISNAKEGKAFAPAGTRTFVSGAFGGQTINNGTIQNILSNAATVKESTVYDCAIVLVGNHQYRNSNTGIEDNSRKPFTLTTVDLDFDNEPDYCLVWQIGQGTNRAMINPVRFDFLPIVEMGVAIKEDASTNLYAMGKLTPWGHFEVTETSIIHFGQFEYENKNRTIEAPVILNNGTYDQFSRGTEGDDDQHITYFLVGGHIKMPTFSPGAQVNDNATFWSRHCAVNVLGGEFAKFYLTGNFNNGVTPNTDDPHCYIDGGKLDIVASAAKEGIDGSVYWRIDHAYIGEFYGGGINADKKVTGNIDITIDRSKVNKFCGGPMFGDMNDGKTVTTNATGTTFGVYYGAGNGGTSYMQYYRFDGNQFQMGQYTTYKHIETINKVEGMNGYHANYELEMVNASAGTDAAINYRTYLYAAQFATTNTGDVTNTLTDCTIETNFFGGGNLGGVNGSVTSLLKGHTVVVGSVYGAGYSASDLSVEIQPGEGYTAPKRDTYTAVITPATYPAKIPYIWTNKTTFGNTTISTGSPHIENPNGDGKNYLFTEIPLVNLGAVSEDVHLTLEDNCKVNGTVFGGGDESAVTGSTFVTLKGNTEVGGSVYGGGNMANVGGNTLVNLTGGIIENDVYGGGCGTDTYDVTTGTGTDAVTKTYYNPLSGIVQGNTTVTVSGGHVVRNVYGGGAMGSVGVFERESSNDANMPGEITGLTSGGKCTVTISGGQIGPDDMTMPTFAGMVFGAGRGESRDTLVYPNLPRVIYVNNTEVNINAGAQIKGSVYGGSESGHVLGDTHVTVNGGTIGNGDSESGTPCAHWDYDLDGLVYDKYAGTSTYDSKGGATTATDGHTFYGNVFGGGSGYTPYAPGKWVRSAGVVRGNTLVEIKGGNIQSNVYGGNECTDVWGSCTVNMEDGTIGVPRSATDVAALPTIGHVYGAGKGDKRVLFNTWTNVASTSVNIQGGTVYGSVYGGGEDGHVLGDAVTTIEEATDKTIVIGNDYISDDASRWDGNVFGGGQGSASALTAGVVAGNVTLNVTSGDIKGSVYGGGRMASVGTYFTDPDAEGYGELHTDDTDDHGNITVNLTGGTIARHVFGGGMGTTNNTYGTADGLGISRNTMVNLNKGVDIAGGKGCIVGGNIFGCNNTNASPKYTATVNIYGTQNSSKTKTKGTYDIAAVYGGGNLAAFIPADNSGTTHVNIYGCNNTSIQQVYGGGNAASTPSTHVDVYSTYEIDEVFGGGNGKDNIVPEGETVEQPNPGANVGYKDYSAFESSDNATNGAATKSLRMANYSYGSGDANVTIHGGTVHRVYGGSNTKGNVRISAVTMLEDVTGCKFHVDEAYGGGKSAPMDATSRLDMACIPGLTTAYGGAMDAEIEGDVELTITNGTYDRVFGGNNVSGYIKGKITVNIEETGCKPLIIGQLYGGGNQAPYRPTTADGRENGINVNVRSFTSIGDIYGGGYGEPAKVTGDTHVNINVDKGRYADKQYKYADDTNVDDYTGKEKELTFTEYKRKYNATDDRWDFVDDNNDGARDTEQEKVSVFLPSFTAGSIGAINNVFGGGNAAEVDGSTYVNIGTGEETKYTEILVKAGADVSSFYTLNAATGEYSKASGTAVDGTKYYMKYEPTGADIRGNVYGGGNQAEVTGNTNVVIGKSAE